MMRDRAVKKQLKRNTVKHSKKRHPYRSLLITWACDCPEASDYLDNRDKQIPSNFLSMDIVVKCTGSFRPGSQHPVKGFGEG
jgi:hypothetical protein